jgi:histidinol-phosphate aminotransferase
MKTIDIYSLARPNIRNLAPYSTARDECQVKIGSFLDANENPFSNGYNRYPDPRQQELKSLISKIKGIPVKNMFIGNGSDEAIDLCFRVFCEPGKDNAVSIAPTYGMYQVAADINDVEVRQVPLGPDFSLPFEGLLSACDDNTKLMFVCSPNNPTGNAFPVAQILSLADRFDGILVVDEAYIDFSSQPSLAGFIKDFPNLIVLQTLSKAYGLAALRLGLAFADERTMSMFANVKYPYNISLAGMEKAMGLLRRDVAAEVEVIKAERARMAEALAALPRVRKVWPSDANFLLVQVDDARSLYDELLDAQVIVRDRSRVLGCDGCLRITIGTREENDKVLAVIGGLKPESVVEKRAAKVVRKTKETEIVVSVDLDSSGTDGIDTGLKFLDHMLDQIVHHAGIYLTVKAKGDLEVDEHHTMEDVAIVLGEALIKALGNKRGIERYGFVLPMDESKAMVLMDLGGRIEFVWDVEFARERVGDVPTEMFWHFFRSLGAAMNCNLHVSAKGENDHHIAEGIFKAFARALRMAVRREQFSYSLPSSKGVL